jgi:hypothetical protein
MANKKRTTRLETGNGAWEAARVNDLVKAQIRERHEVACGDCQWTGQVVFAPSPDNSAHATWICPKCQVPHVVKIAS